MLQIHQSTLFSNLSSCNGWKPQLLAVIVLIASVPSFGILVPRNYVEVSHLDKGSIVVVLGNEMKFHRDSHFGFSQA